MDGVIVGGLIAGAISLGVNGVGWAITLARSSNQASKLQGAFEQKLEDVCTDVNKVDQKVDKVNDKVDKHILNHPGRSARK